MQFPVIDRCNFSKASREFELYCHIEDRDIRLQEKTVCPSCGDGSSGCIDGNMQLVRQQSAKGFAPCRSFNFAIKLIFI